MRKHFCLALAREARVYFVMVPLCRNAQGFSALQICLNRDWQLGGAESKACEGIAFFVL